MFILNYLPFINLAFPVLSVFLPLKWKFYRFRAKKTAHAVNAIALA